MIRMSILLEYFEGLSQLDEMANLKHDRELRDLATRFFEDFQKAVQAKGEERIKPGAMFFSEDFTKMPEAKNVIVMINTQKASIGGSMAGSLKDQGAGVMQVNIEKRRFGKHGLPGKYLYKELPRSIIIHEFMHYLDPGVQKGKNIGPSPKSGGEGGTASDAEYYNRPTEWQAYWQMGADNLEKHLERTYKKDSHLANIHADEPPSFKAFFKRAKSFWPHEFIKNMNKDTERRFIKRLVPIWDVYKDRMQTIYDVSQYVYKGVQKGFKSAEPELQHPKEPKPGKKPRKSKKRDQYNAVVWVEHIKKNLGKYQSKVDWKYIEDFLVDTMHGPFSWNYPSLRENSTASEIANQILTKMR